MFVRGLVFAVTALAFVGLITSTRLLVNTTKANERTLTSSDGAKGRNFRPVTDNAAPTAVFTNSAPITIPASGNAAPYPSAIVVSGISGNIPVTPGSVKVTLNGYSHTFSEDVGIVVVGPTGAALLLQDGAGDGTDMVNVTYTISDTGATQLPAVGAWAPGTYRPTNFFSDSFPAPGPGTTYGNPGPNGGGTATFSSVYGGTAPNGTWNLFVVDFVDGDAGSIAGGWSIEIVTPAAPVTDALADFDGDGTTDYGVIRPAANGQATWHINLNASGNFYQFDWGLATSDWFVPADLNNDGRDDMVVWRPGIQGTFYALLSGTNTILIDDFGLNGDDASVIGDYDGDGDDELAVYRSGVGAGAQSSTYWKNNTTYNKIDWGITDDSTCNADYDGDDRVDFCVQRGNVFHRRFTGGGADSQTILGLAGDIVAPGDYDGDGNADLAVITAVGGFWQWTYKRSIDGVNVVDTWGVVASDDPAPGDYTGDGMADYGVWRFGATSTFHVMTPVTRQIRSKQWGLIDDRAVTTVFTH